MDRWYMVFGEDPHGNRDIPFSFSRKLYAEFILGKHVNRFYILELQGVGHGIPQDRKGVRIGTNCVRQTPCTPNPHWLYPLVGPVINETHKELFHLEDTLL